MIKKAILLAIITSLVLWLLTTFSYSKDLSCTIALSCTSQPFLYISNESGGYNNAHAELINYSPRNYGNIICCSSNQQITTNCSDANANTILKVSNVTNAHVEWKTQNNYGYSACLGSNTYNYCELRTSCLSNETCIASISDVTNAHVGDCNEYSNKICCYVNSLPVVTVPTISPTNPKTTDDLNCSFTITDNDQTNLYANYTWYKNNVPVLSGQISVTNNTNSYIILGSGNTSKGEKWRCEITPYDGIEYGGAKNSSEVTIENSPPTTPTLLEPTNGNTSIIDRTPTFKWTQSSDPDNDPITYEIFVNASEGCNGIPINDTTTNTNYTPTFDLCTENYPTGTSRYYVWKVRACDATSCSNYSETWNFTIQSYLAVTLLTDTVDFGTMTLGDVDNTTDDVPPPFLIRNDGNVPLNLINISVTQNLWDSPQATLPSKYFQAKADNSSEANSFNWSASQTDWFFLGNYSITNIIKELNYQDSSDTAEVDLLIEVPGDEPPGTKVATLQFVFEQS